MARTGLVYCRECLDHDTGRHHPDQPARLTALRAAIDAADLHLVSIEGKPASREDLLRVHSEDHLTNVRRMADAGDAADADTPLSPGSWNAALYAAGAAISAAQAVLEKKADNAFCAVRPPGHHAGRDRAMGFCLFNNVAVAARWLRDVAGVPRVAVVDWDVHHGNGTQDAFYEDDTVFYASVHQYPHYPGTGFPEERGARETNLNVPVSRGAAPTLWVDAVRETIVPELLRFGPEFLLISCGFDGHRIDPLGNQRLEAEHFAAMTEAVRGLASGRVVSVLEGGYHLDALAACAVAHIRALQGRWAAVQDAAEQTMRPRARTRRE